MTRGQSRMLHPTGIIHDFPVDVRMKPKTQNKTGSVCNSAIMAVHYKGVMTHNKKALLTNGEGESKGTTRQVKRQLTKTNHKGN